MTTMTFDVRDSATMTRRSLRHVLRYPVTLVVSVAVPVLLLLLFIGVFGGAIKAGIGTAAHGAYIDYVLPGIMKAGIDVAAAERDLRAHRGVEHRHVPGLVRAVRHRQLQLAFRLVVGAPLQIGRDDCLAHPVRARPRPESLEHRQRRA